MKPFSDQKRILPEFPKTRHLPWKPNTVRGDLVVTEDEAKVIFENRVFVEEKVDGANSGMALVNGEPIIRNREHILRKGFVKNTPAKKQFASIWGWFYDHRENFEALHDLLGRPVAVYGEWMIQIHGMVYTDLPDWFLAFDVYDYEVGKFLDPQLALHNLKLAGFATVPTLTTKVESYEQLEKLANEPSFFADAPREGVYVKTSDGNWQVDRFKMVRQGFVQGGLFDNKTLRKNSLAK